MSWLAAAAPATTAAQGAGAMGMMDAMKKDSDSYGKMPMAQLSASAPQMPAIQAITASQPTNSAAAYYARSKGFGV